jgi:hypothetical protein
MARSQAKARSRKWFSYGALAEQVRQLGDVGGDASGFVAVSG